MNYQVRYHPESHHPYPSHSGKGGLVLYGICMLLLAAFLLRPCVKSFNHVVAQYSQIYDFGALTRDLLQGDSLEESLTGFCLHAMRNGKNT